MNTTIKKRIEDINSGQVPEGYEKTSFGIFPCDWEKDELKHLGEFGKGRGIPGNKMTDEGVPCVGYGDIYMKYNYHFEKAQSFVDIETAKESQLIKKGTLLFTGTGETAEEIGKCVCYNGEEDIYAGGDIITFVANKINPLFLSYQQYLDFALKQKASFGQGHSVVHIQKGNLEKLNCAYPKTEQEQSRIAQILMQWDKTIELQEKMIRLYQKLKKYYLSKMFPKKGSLYPEIRFAGFTEPWKQCKLGELGEFTSNGVDKLSCQNEIPVNLLNYMDVYNRRKITASNCFTLMQVTAKPIQVNNNNVLAGDVYFTPTSETAEDIGHILVIEENLPNTVYSYHLMRYRPKEGVFFKTYPNYGFDTKELHSQMSIKAKGVQRFVISKSDFEDLCLTYPNYEEQQKIAVFFTQIDNIITHNQQKLDKLIAQRKALMQVLLTGIVRV